MQKQSILDYLFYFVRIKNGVEFQNGIQIVFSFKIQKKYVFQQSFLFIFGKSKKQLLFKKFKMTIKTDQDDNFLYKFLNFPGAL
jgi:hypothetical protein